MNQETIRWLLDNFGAAYYACANETQRNRVIEHALTALNNQVRGEGKQP